MSERKKNSDKLWYLEGLLSNGRKWEIPIDKYPFLIGRSSKCDLNLSSKDISRNHAEIVRLGSSLMIRDLASTNGTFLNNKKVAQNTSLQNGDVVHFGSIEFKIVSKDDILQESFTKTRTTKDASYNESFADYYELTNRERDVFYLLIDGKSTKEIAKKLNISDGTAKNYTLSIFKKTSAHSRFELLTLFNKLEKI